MTREEFDALPKPLQAMSSVTEGLIVLFDRWEHGEVLVDCPSYKRGHISRAWLMEVFNPI